jgi:hypothetical protein
MSVISASVDLSNCLKTLTLVWEETRSGWRDSVSQEFAEQHWAPLEAHTQAAIKALERLAPVLVRLQKDCS